MPYQWTVASQSQSLLFTTYIHTQTSPIPFVNCKQKAGWNMTHQKLFWYAVVLIDSFIIYCIMPQSAMTSLQFSVWTALTNENPVSKTDTDTFFKTAVKLWIFFSIKMWSLITYDSYADPIGWVYVNKIKKKIKIRAFSSTLYKMLIEGLCNISTSLWNCHIFAFI